MDTTGCGSCAHNSPRPSGDCPATPPRPPSAATFQSPQVPAQPMLAPSMPTTPNTHHQQLEMVIRQASQNAVGQVLRVESWLSIGIPSESDQQQNVGWKGDPHNELLRLLGGEIQARSFRTASTAVKRELDAGAMGIAPFRPDRRAIEDGENIQTQDARVAGRASTWEDDHNMRASKPSSGCSNAL